MAGFSYAASVPPPHSHQSGEVSMASFCQVPSATSAWPCSLRALEEQNFLFHLQAPEQPPDSTKEVRFPLPSPGSGPPSCLPPLQRRAGEGGRQGAAAHSALALAGPGGSSYCGGAVVDPQAALHKQHLHALQVSDPSFRPGRTHS